jgi:hypothetical protein
MMPRACAAARRLVAAQRTGVDALPQALSFEALGDEVRDAAMLADVVHGEDVRMIERAGAAGLVGETPQPLGIRRVVRQHHFDGHVAVEPLVAGAPHFSGAARA